MIDAQIRSLIDNDPTFRGQRELLMSIPGIGERLAVTILGELPNLSEFRNAKLSGVRRALPARVSLRNVGIGVVAIKDRQQAHPRRTVHARCRGLSAAIPSLRILLLDDDRFW